MRGTHPLPPAIALRELRLGQPEQRIEKPAELIGLSAGDVDRFLEVDLATRRERQVAGDDAGRRSQLVAQLEQEFEPRAVSSSRSRHRRRARLPTRSGPHCQPLVRMVCVASERVKRLGDAPVGIETEPSGDPELMTCVGGRRGSWPARIRVTSAMAAMDRLPQKGLSIVRDCMERVRQGTLEARPGNLEEIARLADICDVPRRGVVVAWLTAVDARARARRSRELSVETRRRSGRLRTRGRLRLIEGRRGADG